MPTIFISQASGNDGNAGTSEGAPVKSLKQAVTNASSGDTIQILDSQTYQPGASADGGRILVGQKALSFVAATGQTPTFAGQGARTNGAATKTAFNCSGMSVAGTVMSFEGITFEDFNGSGNTIITSNGQTAPTQKFIDCIFQNMDQSIISNPAAASSGVPNLIDRCEIKSTTPDLFLGPGSHIQGADHHIVIQNSIFHNTSSSPSTNYIDCQNNNHTNGIIRNCTLLVDRANGTTVIRFGVVENVIIKNTAAGSVDANLVGIDARSSYSNNCVNGTFGTSNGAIKDNTGSGATDGGGNITTDPLFVNQSSIPEGLKLQSGSPCIGTGKTIAAVTVDFDGTSRSAPYDIGAFQFVSTAPSFTDDGSETHQRHFDSQLNIMSTANKLATRGFINDRNNRQAPFSVTVSGPATIRRRTTPYKNET